MYFDDKDGVWVFTQDSTIDDIIKWYDMGEPEYDIDETYYYNTIYNQCLEEGEVVERQYEEPRRWCRWCHCIIKYNDRYFDIGYDEGLTEYQENLFDNSDIVEVIPKEETVVIRKWIEKKA